MWFFSTRVRFFLILFCSLITLVGCGGSDTTTTSTPQATAKPATTAQPTQASGTACVSQQAGNGLQNFRIAKGSEASYTVYEKLILTGNDHNKVVGKTSDVQGGFLAKTTGTPEIGNMQITINLTNLHTDSDRRDHYVQENYLQTAIYPTAVFKSPCGVKLTRAYQPGQTVTFKINGDLTMHGKTKPETFDVQGKFDNGSISGVATTKILMTDFGIDPPNLAQIAISENQVQLSINFTLKQG